MNKLVFVVLVFLGIIVGVGLAKIDAITGAWDAWQAQRAEQAQQSAERVKLAVKQAEEEQIRKLPLMAAEIRAKTEGVKNYGELVRQGKTGYQQHSAVSQYKARAAALNEDVKEYARLLQKLPEQNKDLPDPTTLFQPVDAPTSATAPNP